jgi:hypothetical protein
VAIAISSITSGTDTGASATVSVTTSESPTTTKVGDLVVVVYANDFYALSNMGTPSATGTPTMNAIAGATGDGGSNEAHIKAWWYVANTAGAQTVSATESGAHDEEKSITAYVLTGADTTTPVDAAAGNTSTTTITTSQVAPAVSPTTTNAFLICQITAGGGAAAASYTTPSPLTEQFEIHAGSISGVGATNQLSASGSTGTFTFTAASSTAYSSCSIAIKTATAASATYPPQRARSREAPPLRIAKTRQTTPVRSQVNPPYPTQEIHPTRQLRGFLLRRGKIRETVRAQVNPPFPFAEIHPTRQLRGLLPRRGRLASPVPPQIVLTPPPYPPQVVRVRPKMLRWFRGREAQPVPPPVVVTPPAFVPDRSHRTRLFTWVRREHPAVPLAVPDVPDNLKRDRPNLLASRWPKMAAPIPEQTAPPVGRPARHPAALRLRHGGFIAVPLKQQPPPVNPDFVPGIARRRVPALPTRRGRYVISWASSCDCTTHRPNVGITVRPGSGVTARPNTGVTGRPCTC